MENKRNLLYLAGGMEFAEDGISWRDQARDTLIKYGLKVWHPYEEEAKIFNNKNLEFLKTADKEKDFIQYKKIMRKIVKNDLTDLSTKVSTVLVKYNSSALKGAGTHSEMSIAAFLGIPVHVWLDGLTLVEVPAWTIGCIDYIYYSLEELLNSVIKNEYT